MGPTLRGEMPYSVGMRNGRWFVTSPKGKVWKTTYKDEPAAQKAVAYVESRFSGGSSSAKPTQPEESPDTSKEREELGIQPREKVDTEGW